MSMTRQAPITVVDDAHCGKWIKEGTVVDSGAVERVTSRKLFPRLNVEETRETRRGKTWTCAGGEEIRKEGKVMINRMTVLSASKKSIHNRVGVSHADLC